MNNIKNKKIKKDIAKENLELEVKIQTEDINELMSWLEKNATFIKETNQRDYYFEREDKPFIFENKFGYKTAHEWLRVRFSDKGTNLCYKKNHNDDNDTMLYSDEIEVGIEDGNKIINILRALDYNQSVLVVKNRKSYKYKEYQFDVDNIEGLGIFVEIEFQGKITNLESGRNKINKFLKSIGVTNYKQVDTGYPQLFWNNKIIYVEDRNGN